jgi:hypothetical protein
MEPLDSSKVALINEYKGNVFEYLVAQEIKKNIENTEIIWPKGMHEMVMIQERYIRKYDPVLWSNLPKMATAYANDFLQSLAKEVVLLKIIGTGKLNNQIQDLNGSDLIFETKGAPIGLSIKMAKSSSWVNTKSSGLQSFSKYFEKNDLFQVDFNSWLNEKYKDFSYELHEVYGLDPSSNFNDWKKKNLPLLPGDLSSKGKFVLYNFYQSIILKLVDYFEDLILKNEKKFIQGIKNILSWDSTEKHIGICFYKEIDMSFKNVVFRPSHFDFKNYGPLITNKSNFEIHFPRFNVQFRVKPMNTFTQPGFKLNISYQLTK